MRNSALTRGGILLAVLLSLFGLTVSAILLQHHVVILIGGDPVLGRLCEADYASCDEVLSSKWSRLFGLPVAMWGFFFFSAMSAWYLVIGRPTGSRRWLHGLPLLATGAGTLGVIGLAIIMYGVIKGLCPFCAATHVTTLLLFIVTFLLRPRRVASQAVLSSGSALAGGEADAAAPAHPSWRLVFAAVLLAVMTSFVGWSEYGRRLQSSYAREYQKRWQEYENLLASSRKASEAQEAGFAVAKKQWEAQEALLKGVYDKFMAQEVVDLPLTADDPIRGDANAPHTIVVYSDFQCPWCKTLADILDKKMQEYPGRFRVAFRHFPMDKLCNPDISQTLHPGACPAAVTAEAARLLGGPEAFWKTHDALFADQKAFRAGAQKFVKDHALKMGIDPEAFWKKATGSTSTWNRVKEDVKKATELGTKSTPAVYLDGRKFDRYGDEYFWRYMFGLEDQGKSLESAGRGLPTTWPDATPTSMPSSRPVLPRSGSAASP
ncbi:MAG TPA: vitamin K epoxide reductase family protein [Phycisphaerae bacterium]|nr:vitamin K epoxide reductase family protein [Phycisphaerae bacterium]HRY69400.1 vitamin K epoxide reductase family protein [Phycisphaerae bacterium]HSA26267.1 vitamin K epoxide reductase family protein [Phycisphaerae bacterium]